MLCKNSLQLNNNFSLPILSNNDCNSKNCIQILNWSLCDNYYIGETSLAFKTRFYNHLSKIRKFNLFESNDSEVATHFNLKNHNFERDLRAFIVLKDIDDTNKRRNIEAELIHLFLLFDCKIINNKLYKFSTYFCTR